MPLPAPHPLFEMHTPHYEAGGRDSKMFYYSQKAPNVTRSRIILAILMGSCVLLLILIVSLNRGAEECEIQNKIITMKCDETTTRQVNGICTPRLLSCGPEGILGEDGVCVKENSSVSLKAVALLAMIPLLVLVVKPLLLPQKGSEQKGLGEAGEASVPEEALEEDEALHSAADIRRLDELGLSHLPLRLKLIESEAAVVAASEAAKPMEQTSQEIEDAEKAEKAANSGFIRRLLNGSKRFVSTLRVPDDNDV